MAVANLRNFLRKLQSSRNLFTHNGSFDDQIHSKLVPGRLKNELDNANELLPLQNIPRRSFKNAKLIRDV